MNIDEQWQEMRRFLEDEEADRMRQENEAATARLREYIEQHRGCTLGLSLFTALFEQYGRD